MACATPGAGIVVWRIITPAALVVAAMVACAGCTLCPDPFDYSGPVPNGSPPQNDFRARSGGILPLNAAPKPWPPVVKDDARLPEPGPTIAEPEPQLADDPDPVTLQQTGAIVSEVDGLGERGMTAGGSEDVDVMELQVTVPALTPILPVPSGGLQEANPATAAEPVAGTAPAPAAAPSETPGWRSRRRGGG